MTETAVIEIDDVWKIYGSKIKTTVLQGISLCIEKGEFIAIIGPSGSGKSTLMHLMGCLDRPTMGKVIVNGQNISALSQDQLADIRAKKIGFVFQSYNLLARKTARKNVELPLTFQGVNPGERRGKAIELLQSVGLGHRIHHTPAQMSGGEQQRVAIARALVSNPSIIIADEPTGNLDTKSTLEIMSILKQLNDEGKTLIMVTHDPDIADWADRTIRIRDGRLIEDET